MKNVSQSMTGRAAIFYMEPLSMKEIHGEAEVPFIPNEGSIKQMMNHPLSVKDLYEQISQGLYPELYSNPNLTSEMFYARYGATYIDRDINELLEVRYKNKFHNFMQILASLKRIILKRKECCVSSYLLILRIYIEIGYFKIESLQ